MPLGATQAPYDDLISYLQQEGFTSLEIAQLKRTGHLVLIADGFDEMRQEALKQAPNLYDLNYFDDEKHERRIKLLIGCRSQYVHTITEANVFVPHLSDGSPDWLHYRVRCVAPFTPEQIKDYTGKYVSQQKNDPNRPQGWDAARYEKALTEIPGLSALVDTPFMLWMILSILPQLTEEQTLKQSKTQKEEKENKDHEKIKEIKRSVSPPNITRVEVYERFMRGWFANAARKAWQSQQYLKDPAAILGKNKVQALREEAANSGGEDVQVLWFMETCRLYCLAFAQALSRIGGVNLKIDTIDPKTTSIDKTIQLLQHPLLSQGSPVQTGQDQAKSFMHAALFDYWMTTAIVEGLLLKPEDKPTEPFAPTYAQAVALLARVHLSFDQVNFLVDRVKTNSTLQAALFAIIERSKTDKYIPFASANAATVLNACHIDFIGMNWRNVELPGADLRYGLLAHSDLRHANLRGANLMQTMWFHANLAGRRFTRSAVGRTAPFIVGYLSWRYSTSSLSTLVSRSARKRRDSMGYKNRQTTGLSVDRTYRRNSQRSV